ncbi:MAG: hypothetical protein CM15mP68_5720 [Pseudomonadota bacterium]|nr:MAG: hypothetical protein CM15mP68_5720 [Pseudomonadota bacterium]
MVETLKNDFFRTVYTSPNCHRLLRRELDAQGVILGVVAFRH